MKKHRQNMEVSAQTTKKRVQEKFDALRRRSPRSAGRPCRRSERSLAAAPQHHDQAPGFYRLKVGDLEVNGPIRWQPAYSIRTG